jgi:glycerol kinase
VQPLPCADEYAAGCQTNAADFGLSDEALFGKTLPILSAAGDQQSALVGQGCLSPGMAKITYGTGAFLVANSGKEKPESKTACWERLATKRRKAGQWRWKDPSSMRAPW